MVVVMLELDSSLTEYEDRCYHNGYKCVAGVDEVGRGPLAGPVVAAACILPEGMIIPSINDSKKLTPKQRLIFFEILTSNPEIIFAVGIVEPVDIDKLNILQASLKAMLISIENLSSPPGYLLVDGLHCPHTTIPSEGIVKGDQKSQSIAAASIIAKVTRDRMMLRYHQLWPNYGFDRHKGYGTASHLEALAKFGPISIHRKTFKPIKSFEE